MIAFSASFLSSRWRSSSAIVRRDAKFLLWCMQIIPEIKAALSFEPSIQTTFSKHILQSLIRRGPKVRSRPGNHHYSSCLQKAANSAAPSLLPAICLKMRLVDPQRLKVLCCSSHFGCPVLFFFLGAYGSYQGESLTKLSQCFGKTPKPRLNKARRFPPDDDPCCFEASSVSRASCLGKPNPPL